MSLNQRVIRLYHAYSVFVSKFLSMFFLHFARASGDDHASTGVPPQSVSTRPKNYKTVSNQVEHDCDQTFTI